MRIWRPDLIEAFKNHGYMVLAVRQFGDQIYVQIADRDELEEASEFGRGLGVIVSVRV